MLPVLAFSFQAIGGGCGLFRVQDVKSEGYGFLTITEHTLLRSVNDQGEADAAFALAYAPYDWMEAFVSPGGAGGIDDLMSLPDEPVFDVTWRDLRGGLKLGLPIIPVLKLGIAGYYQYPLRDTWHFQDYPSLTGQYLGGQLNAALELIDVLPSLPLTIIGNYGYYMHTAPDTVKSSVGAGVELAAERVAVFVEAYSEYFKGGKPFGSTSETHVAPCLRVRFGSGLGLAQGLGVHHVELDVMAVQTEVGADEMHEVVEAVLAFQNLGIELHVQQRPAGAAVVHLGGGFEHRRWALAIRALDRPRWNASVINSSKRSASAPSTYLQK
jgi:hypothetical protein